MSKTCDFYIECAEQGIFPLEADRPRPAGVKLRQFTTIDYLGQPMVVTGVGTADAIQWWNAKHDREVPAPAGLLEWLTDFAGCGHCDDCGCVGRPHYFAMSGHGERLCVDCA